MSDRPTKVQGELLEFIDNFIREHGYGPSYREIMNSLNYKSVSTVAVHVDNLIKIGRLQKTDHSARSLVVVDEAHAARLQVDSSQAGWLIKQVEARLADYQKQPTPKKRQDLEILAQALDVLGLDQAAAQLHSQLNQKPLA